MSVCWGVESARLGPRCGGKPRPSEVGRGHAQERPELRSEGRGSDEHRRTSAPKRGRRCSLGGRGGGRSGRRDWSEAPKPASLSAAEPMFVQVRALASASCGAIANPTSPHDMPRIWCLTAQRPGHRPFSHHSDANRSPARAADQGKKQKVLTAIACATPGGSGSR